MELLEIRRTCVGLDIFTAKNRLLSMFPEMKETDIEITYQESDYQRFIVTDCKIFDGKKIKMVANKENELDLETYTE